MIYQFKKKNDTPTLAIRNAGKSAEMKVITLTLRQIPPSKHPDYIESEKDISFTPIPASIAQKDRLIG